VVEGSAKRPIQGTFTEVLLERAARLKATRQRVFISGLEGSHTLEVGVAYHYRGHFIYAYPAGNPIEPVPFSTKKGINIVGLVQDRAPIFNSKAPHLVPESEIAALQRACIHEKEFQNEQEEASKEETKKALKEEAKQDAEDAASTEEEVETATTVETAAQEPLPASLAPSRVPSFTTLLVPSQVSSRFGSQVSLDHLSAPSHRASESLSNVPRIGTVEAPDVTSTSTFESQTGSGTSYTPHDRGHYLAYSAPGSRHGSVDHTPFVSRPVSPTHGLSVRGHGHNSLLRPASSTSRLNQLLAEEGVRRALSPLAEDRPSERQSGVWDEDMIADLSVAQGWIDPTDIDAFVQTVSRRPSRPSSRQASCPRSRMQSPSPQPTTPDDEIDSGLFLPGLGHPDVIRSTSRNQSRSQSPMPPSTHSGFRMGSVDHDTGSRPPSRQYSPMPPTSTGSPSYDSAESTAYLCCLAQRHYEMENPVSRSHSPLPPATQDIHHHSLRGGGVQLDQSSRSQTPVMQGPSYRQLAGSRTHSPFLPVVQETQTHGHEHRDNTSRPAFQTTAFPTFTSRTPTPTTYVSKPLNTGRPRAASQALNEAYNAANPPASTPHPLIQPNKHDDLGHFNFPHTNERSERSETGSSSNPSTIHPRNPKCAIHDETCDGKFVEHLHLTERSRQGSGFVDLFPFIKGEGKEERVMIDWATIRDKERGKLRREGRYPLA
jgi:hypothetical protein